MKHILKHFPKEIGFPSRIVTYDIKDFFKKFDNVNGKYNKVYFQLYNNAPNGKQTNYPLIHLTAFDIDSDKKYENMKTIHEKLNEMDLKHCVVFSTSGFWVYVLNKNYEKLKYPKDALFNTHEFMAKEFDMEFGSAKNSDLDKSIRGDIKRIGRMIGSYDIDRQRYCFSLTEKDIYNGYDNIVKKSETHQSIKVNWFSKSLFDISQHDSISELQTIQYKRLSKDSIIKKANVPLIKYDFENRDVPLYIKDFMPCVVNWLTEEGGTSWEKRFYATLFMVKIGLPDDIIDKICKMIFIKQPRSDSCRNNYNHWQKANVLRQAHKQTMSFPRIEKLYELGFIEGASKDDYMLFNKHLLYNYYPASKFEEQKSEPISYDSTTGIKL